MRNKSLNKGLCDTGQCLTDGSAGYIGFTQYSCKLLGLKNVLNGFADTVYGTIFDSYLRYGFTGLFSKSLAFGKNKAISAKRVAYCRKKARKYPKRQAVH